MLNLLFISDSPKAEYIKSVLQPVLKVIIDVVTDFDQGLKNVFEKRPSTVCIQDQIGGVTGESVARHIQMLLGNSAPSFILLHTGNDNAKAIVGLYEHIIDLSQSDDAVAEDIENTLKSLLGDQWGRIYIPHKSAPALVELPATVVEESLEDADNIEDSFLSGPDTSEDTYRDADSDRAKAINDDLTELLLLEADKVLREEDSIAESLADTAASEEDVITAPKQETVELKQSLPDIFEPVTPPEAFIDKPTLDKVDVSETGFNDSKLSTGSVGATSTPAAAEFRISQKANQAEEYIPEELLLAFEENYRSESPLWRRTVVIVLVCALCAAGGWYLVRQNPQVVRSLTERFLPSSGAKQSVVNAPVAVAVPPVQKQVAPPSAALTLPVFIPKEGHDSLYAVKNPGWERYVDKQNEYRIFSESGRILAVQVLAMNDAKIPETLIKSVLLELVGSADYQITSRSTKTGLRVENGKIQNKGEIKIYRKNGAVMAFVMSVN
jgi:flagellar FliL protein